MARENKLQQSSDAENQRKTYLNLDIGKPTQDSKARVAAKEVAKESLEKAKQLLKENQQDD